MSSSSGGSNNGGLSDVLRQMADSAKPGTGTGTGTGTGQSTTDPAATDPFSDLRPDGAAAGIDDESGELLGAAMAESAGENLDPAAASGLAAESAGASPSPAAARSAARPRRPAPSTGGLKAAAVPVLATVGALLLIPGFWSVSYLLGMPLWVPSGKEGEANGMAWVMLLCLPMAAVLLFAAVFFYQQLRQARERAQALIARFS